MAAPLPRTIAGRRLKPSRGGIVLAILLATMVAALLMTWVPARQAARVAPAEALRYE